MKKIIFIVTTVFLVLGLTAAFRTLKVTVQPSLEDGGYGPVKIPIQGWESAVCCVESANTVYFVTSASVRSEDGGKRLCKACAAQCIDGMKPKTPIYATLPTREDGGAIVECLEQK